MPTTIQRAELTDRLRRAFSVRGQLVPELDEMVQLVAHCYDLDEVPYRVDGVRWMGGGSTAGTVGNRSLVFVNNDQPAGSRQLKLEQLIITNPGAAVLPAQFGFGAASISGNAVRTGELQQQGITGTISDVVSGLAATVGANSGAAGTRIVLGLGEIDIPVGVSTFRLDLAIPAGTAFYLETTGVGTFPLKMAALGRFWLS